MLFWSPLITIAAAPSMAQFHLGMGGLNNLRTT
jgi:hypothetical protein